VIRSVSGRIILLGCEFVIILSRYDNLNCLAMGIYTENPQYF
jgi:hypothetical protein